MMQGAFLLIRDPGSHPLAKNFPSGTLLERPDGRLRIESDEAHMEELMSEINAAYYSGIIDISQVEVVMAPENKVLGNPLLETLSATA